MLQETSSANGIHGIFPGIFSLKACFSSLTFMNLGRCTVDVKMVVLPNTMVWQTNGPADQANTRFWTCPHAH